MHVFPLSHTCTGATTWPSASPGRIAGLSKQTARYCGTKHQGTAPHVIGSSSLSIWSSRYNQPARATRQCFHVSARRHARYGRFCQFHNKTQVHTERPGGTSWLSAAFISRPSPFPTQEPLRQPWLGLPAAKLLARAVSLQWLLGPSPPPVVPARRRISGWWSPLKFHCQNEKPSIVWIRKYPWDRSQKPGTRAPDQGLSGLKGASPASQPARPQVQRPPSHLSSSMAPSLPQHLCPSNCDIVIAISHSQ